MIVQLDVTTARAMWRPAFLALAIWREARGASTEAKIAVGYSIMNRVARPSWWGRTLEEVLGKKWQYSSLAAPGDPQLLLYPRCEDPSWRECLAVSRAVLAKDIPNPFPSADSYFDSSITAPKWATPATFRGQVASTHGNTLFFHDVDHDFEATAIGRA